MKCPVDNSELQMTERQGVEIDYCPKCRGVWLDRGELDKVIERATPPERIKPDFNQDSSHNKHGRYDDRGYKKRKNMLGELFDF
jgi:Zn-finger nucleic acid-binding protein